MFPDVAAIMLCNGRPEMVRRAIRSFESQSYENKRLIVFENTGDRSIGRLRNEANALAGNADILVHFDSDDWSHPNRISEQVALLQSSGAECVGYHEMLFWDSTPKARMAQEIGPQVKLDDPGGQAWLYRADMKNYVVGTSMCYWRNTWERFPFPDYSEGCDDLRWSSGDTRTGMRAVKIVGAAIQPDRAVENDGPRMIAGIHGGNTCAKIAAQGKTWEKVWTRVPDWDAYCMETMKL